MKKPKVFFIFALILAVSAIGFASPVSPCPTASLNTYLSAGFSCELGNEVFSDFSYGSSASGGATALPSGGIDVVTVGSSGSGASIIQPGSGEGFEFIGDWSATTGQTSDSVIQFQDAVTGGSLQDAAIAQLASGVLGTGTASVEEEGCGVITPATSCTPGQWDLFTFNSTNPNLVQLGATTMTSSSGVYDIVKNIAVTGGTGGAVTLSDVSDIFCPQQPSPTPEPGTLLLSAAGVGLLFVGRCRRRRLRG